MIGAFSIPLGLLLVAAEDWGIPADDIFDLLGGASVASLDGARAFGVVAGELTAAGVDPTTVESLDAVRAASPGASKALDEALRIYGWRLIEEADIDGRSLGEAPDAVLALIGTVVKEPTIDPDAAAVRRVRKRVPAAERQRFDDLLDDARGGYAIRDHNAHVTMGWSFGLVRRALLEAGRRLADTEHGRLRDAADVFDLDVSETASLLAGAAAPTADEVAARAAARTAADRVEPPPFLGDPPEPPPDASVFPKEMALLTRATALHQRLLFEPRPTATGIGTTPATGRAVVALSAADALARVEPGDVLVTTMTSPGFNAILPMLSGLVTEEGGPLTHAAIMARELSLPAVLGLAGATTRFADGTTVTLDPVAATVEVAQ